ncbi:MAG: hypothetical protein KF830_10110 [Planctomycetes bacterium]|nr:hypothetical protein [Planctomycetota bacterium]
MNEDPRPMTGPRVAAGMALLLTLLLVWGNGKGVGASPPDEPAALAMTTTWSALGLWPYLVVDGTGARVQWPGMLVGVLATLLAGTACLAWLRHLAMRGRRAEAGR